jgi:hypothetical protein
MHKSIAFATLSLVSLPAWVGDGNNVTYKFKLLSETQRLDNGMVEVVDEKPNCLTRECYRVVGP